MTPAGIEPATFRFVMQRLNHCVTAVPSCGHRAGTNLNEMYLLLQSDLSCRNTKQTVGAIYTRTNFVTLKYVTDGWGTESNGFKLVITAFKDKSKYAVNRYQFCQVHFLCCHTSLHLAYFNSTVRSPLIRINWDGELSACAENPDYWIFL